MSEQPVADDTDTACPDLRLVADNTASSENQHEPVVIDTPAAVLDSDGQPVAPRAPLDVRLRETVLAFVRGLPAFGQVPASFRESIDYSQRGDWATSETSAKRVVHGLATVLAFVGTYPLVEGLGKAREKPVGLVLTVLLTIATVATITALLS